MKSLKGLLQPKIYAITLLFSLLVVAACSKKDKSMADDQAMKTHTNAFVVPIEKAHKMDAWKSKGALKTNIEVSFGKQPLLHARLMVATSGPGIRLQIGKDTVAVFNGTHMWAIPSDSAVGPFTLKTWAYFLEAPYKLNDPGTHVESMGSAQMDGKTYDRAKLTFDAGTGDSPNDWFVLYRSQHTNRLKAMSYIVTYGGKTVEEAGKHPHAITYENVKIVEGIPISTRWKFWTWSKENGFSDKPIGQAKLTNIQFVNADHLFAKPDGAMKMKR